MTKHANTYQHADRYLMPDAVGCWMSARVASVIYARTDLGRIRTELRGLDPEVDAVLMAMHVAALKWRASVSGSEPRKQAEEPADSPTWVSAAEAAADLDLTSSRIRQELREGRLKGEKVGGGWRITRVELETYKAARAA